MSRARHDYDLLRQEYITTDIGVRELCRKHGIKSWSTVNARKLKEDWDGKREQYKQDVGNREVATLVDAKIRTIAEIHDELLLAIRAAIRRYINDVSAESGAQSVSARDLMGLIDKFLLLSGSTPHRTESRNLDAHSFTLDGILRDAPPDLLRELASLAEDKGSGGRPMGRGPLVVLEGTG